jgi:hypothetical protein
MAAYIEMINPKTKMCSLLKDGVIVEQFKMEQCDKCSQLSRLDAFGYQKGYDRHENIIWFCVQCR